MTDSLLQRRIKITYIITGLSTGGAETMLLRLLQHMNHERFQISVISLTEIGDIGPRITSLGIPVVALGMKRGRINILSIFRLIWILLETKPIIVHTWMYHASLIGGLVSRITRTPILIWGIHSADCWTTATKNATKVIIWCCARISHWLPDHIQYVSTHSRLFHEGLGYSASKAKVIPNGVDLTEFRPNVSARDAIRGELCLARETPLVGLVSRYDPIKDIEGFLRAADYLNRDMPGVHFLMAGQGLDRTNAALVGLVGEIGLVDVVHLLGRRVDVPLVLASLDLACLTSKGEAFGIVLVEAMGCGIPCISTDCGSQLAILGSRDWLVPVGDMKQMAEKLRLILSKSDVDRKRIGLAARSRALEYFDLSPVVKMYESMYNGAFCALNPKNG